MYEESRDLLNRALAVDKERPVKERKRNRTLLGIIDHFDNKPAQAQSVLKEALDMKPPDDEEDSAALYTMAKSYIGVGKTDEARKLLQKVVDEYPGGKPAARAKEALESLSTK